MSVSGVHKVIQIVYMHVCVYIYIYIYIYIYTHFFRFFFITGYYKILSIVAYAIQYILGVYLFHI